MAGQEIVSPAAFPDALTSFAPSPLIVCHNDADGLSAGAILHVALRRAGLAASVRILSKGENAYSAAFQAEIAGRRAGGLILADVGTSAALDLPGIPTVVIDHHVPTGLPERATVISGIGERPIPTSSLLAYRCARALGAADDLLWLAAVGIIGDMAENDGFPELDEARARCGITALRKAASLVNAPRRSSTGDAAPAFALLQKADGPKAVLSGAHPETAVLLAAKNEVKREIEAARKVGPRIVGQVAMVFFRSPCQIHPLVAQAWRNRLADRIVVAANAGYRPGWVHFAARTALDLDILEFLASVRPPGADEQYGNGHRAASGGALRDSDWNRFVDALGFGRAMHVGNVAAAA